MSPPIGLPPSWHFFATRFPPPLCHFFLSLYSLLVFFCLRDRRSATSYVSTAQNPPALPDVSSCTFWWIRTFMIARQRLVNFKKSPLTFPCMFLQHPFPCNRSASPGFLKRLSCLFSLTDAPDGFLVLMVSRTIFAAVSALMIS